MPTVVDLDTLNVRLAQEWPGMWVSTPPLPASGRCGICGVPGLDPATAPYGISVIPPTDFALDVLLCPAHAGRAT